MTSSPVNMPNVLRAYESMTHDELEERLDELRAQRGTLECEEPDDLDSEAYEEWEEQCG